MENWKDIKEFEGQYQVSDLGDVRSLDRKVVHADGMVRFLKGKLLKQSLTTAGYYFVALCSESTYKTVRIHRLVAEHFIDNPMNKPQVNHKDGIKTNNNVENLEWATPTENLVHAYETGLMGVDKNVGETNGSSKISEREVVEIRELANQGYSRREIAIIYGIGKTTVTKIVNRDSWKHIV